jgi:hypothetical protein
MVYFELEGEYVLFFDQLKIADHFVLFLSWFDRHVTRLRVGFLCTLRAKKSLVREIF